MDKIELYNHFHNQKFIKEVLVLQYNHFLNIAKIRCENNIESSLANIKNAIECDSFTYDDFINLQLNECSKNKYIPELFLTDLSIVIDKISNESFEDALKIMNKYFISKLKILFYSGIIEIVSNQFEILMDDDGFYNGGTYSNLSGLYLKDLVYKNPCELYYAIENIHSGIHNNSDLRSECGSKYKLNFYSQCNITHTRYFDLLGRKNPKAFRKYPFYVDIQTAPKNDFITIELAMNIAYLKDSSLYNDLDNFFETGRDFAEKYLDDWNIDISEALDSKEGIDFVTNELESKPILMMECIKYANISVDELVEKIKHYLEKLSIVSNISLEEINDYYFGAQLDFDIDLDLDNTDSNYCPQIASNNYLQKVKEFIGLEKAKCTSIELYSPKYALDVIKKQFAPIEDIINNVLYLELYLLGYIKEYNGKVIRQDYSVVMKGSTYHGSIKEGCIVLTPYLYLDAAKVYTSGLFLDKKKDELPDLSNMLLNVADIFEIKKKFKDNEQLYDYIIDKMVSGFIHEVSKGTIIAKNRSNIKFRLSSKDYEEYKDKLIEVMETKKKQVII